MNRERAKATAPLSYSDLAWKFSSHDWFEDVEAWHNYERIIDWLKNFKINLQTNDIQHSVSDLPPIEGSALVIDKSMASTKFFEQIHHLKDYKGTIICCDRALYHIIPYVRQSESKLRLVETDLEYGFIGNTTITRPPDASTYVCNLDSSYLCMSFIDRPDVKKVMDKITAVFSVTTHPLTIRHWHGKRVFFTPYMSSLGLTKIMMEKSGTPLVPTGGQVASFAYVLAYNLGANPIGVFGITNSYDSIKETEYPGILHDRLEGPYGVCWQDPVYRFYNDYYLYFIEQAKKDGIETINTTKAGLLYSDDITDMTLEEFVRNE